MNSFIAWIGGKKLLRKAIIECFPKDGFDRYIEVFGGAGWILFAKDSHAPLEVFNDANLAKVVDTVKNTNKAISNTKKEVIEKEGQEANQPKNKPVKKKPTKKKHTDILDKVNRLKEDMQNKTS